MKFPKPIKLKKNKQFRTIKKRSNDKKILKERLQKLFNKYIVLRDGRCVTCGSEHNLQCSHYYSVGSSPAIRYDERNAHAQCARCHLEYHHKGGYQYTRYLIRVLWMEGLDKLEADSKQVVKYGEEWLREKIAEYESRIKNPQTVIHGFSIIQQIRSSSRV